MNLSVMVYVSFWCVSTYAKKKKKNTFLTHLLSAQREYLPFTDSWLKQHKSQTLDSSTTVTTLFIVIM